MKYLRPCLGPKGLVGIIIFKVKSVAETIHFSARNSSGNIFNMSVRSVKGAMLKSTLLVVYSL